MLNSPVRLLRRDGTRRGIHEIGALGERIAACHLQARGRKILFRNFTSERGGEIDLVVRHGETLVFVEVKTRAGQARGRPLDAVDRAKQARLRAGGEAWLRALGRRDLRWRYDVAEVTLADGEKPEVHIVENAF